MTHLLTLCKNQYITGAKLGRTTAAFSQERVPRERKKRSLKNLQKESIILLTRDLTAVKLEAQRNAILPRLRSDSNEASKNRLGDPIENHLGGISVAMENLQHGEREAGDM